MPVAPALTELREVEAEKAAIEKLIRLRDEVCRLRIRANIADSSADALCCILDFVATRMGCSSTQIIGKGRQNAIAWPRHLVCHLCRHATGMSLERVGKGLGGRDHGTVLNSTRAVADRRATEPSFDQLVKEMEAEVVLLLAEKGEGKS